MYCVRIEKIFYDMQGLHFTSSNHFLGSYWRMCSTKAKKVSQEGGRQGKQGTADGRGREDVQHDGGGGPSRMGKGAPAGLWSSQLQLGINKDSEKGVNRETINLTLYLTMLKSISNFCGKPGG